MKRIFNRIESGFESLLKTGSDNLDSLLFRDTHHIVITGLSRSGKSMLFTSLMSLFGQRVNQAYDNLPLLNVIPRDLVEKFEILPISGEKVFPLDQHLQMLQSQQWPNATDEVYGFELVLTLRPTNFLKKVINKTNKVVFRFYDYPGEWLTDLPMLDKDFISWSNSAWAQQLAEPQKFYASEWHKFVEIFDFDRPPTPESVSSYINAYKAYLTSAKQGGISLLQPGSLLLPNPILNWDLNGFAPLPSKVISDPENLWKQQFEQGFIKFQNDWLRPLKETYFNRADKQIVLIDLLEGLGHGKAHLEQIKETVSHLSSSFVYGAEKWYKPKFLFESAITKVAFVATKVDLIPMSQQSSLMSLLQETTSGVRAHLKDNKVDFQHFLVSAIKATDDGDTTNALRFTNRDGVYEEWEFKPLPNSFKELSDKENYPLIESKVPKDFLTRINHAQGIDRLIQYLID